ncbi:ribonuclease P protein subunit p14 isoform X2 [Temnothorax curvispinosus]|uniref:Ribonuclease P protein subunit p14 isoform X2 n=1 Tax=Temnothorax curvispinosus TaxID=300111 RepID=A0A6J1PQH3_9HYME|nr:ribonuclease P protein subunit p14 isoform X2 [Temnothorax curvispinosus]
MKRRTWPCKCITCNRVEISSDLDLTVSPVYLKKNVLEAVRSLFGEEGAKSPIDVLKIYPAKRRFILRCPYNSYVRLRASLTLSTAYEGKTCVYTVHRASSNLLSFTADSRTYQHGEVPPESSPCH